MASTSLGPGSLVVERVAAHRQAGATHPQVTQVPTGEQTQPQLLEELSQLVG